MKTLQRRDLICKLLDLPSIILRITFCDTNIDQQSFLNTRLIVMFCYLYRRTVDD